MIQRTIRGPPNAQTGSTSNQLTPKAPYKPAPAKAGGRCMDNIFVERLWRSLKYEEVYLNAYASVAEAKAGIGAWLGFYNPASSHPSLYVTEKKRFCGSGCGPVGWFGRFRARRTRAFAAVLSRTARLKTQGPSGKGCSASISRHSAAKRNVLGLICRCAAALLRLSHGSWPSSAGQ